MRKFKISICLISFASLLSCSDAQNLQADLSDVENLRESPVYEGYKVDVTGADADDLYAAMVLMDAPKLDVEAISPRQLSADGVSLTCGAEQLCVVHFKPRILKDVPNAVYLAYEDQNGRTYARIQLSDTDDIGIFNMIQSLAIGLSGDKSNKFYSHKSQRFINDKSEFGVSVLNYPAFKEVLATFRIDVTDEIRPGIDTISKKEDVDGPIEI